MALFVLTAGGVIVVLDQLVDELLLDSQTIFTRGRFVDDWRNELLENIRRESRKLHGTLVMVIFDYFSIGKS